MRINHFLSGLLLCLASLAHAAPLTLNIDSEQTYEQYQLGQTGFGMQSGKFTRTHGTIVLDTDAQTGSVYVKIEAPELQDIYFQSKSMNFASDKLINVTGQLTIMGISKPVTLAVTRFDHNKAPSGKLVYTANAETSIKLSDYEIKTYIPGFPDDVKLTLFIVATNQSDPSKTSAPQ